MSGKLIFVSGLAGAGKTTLVCEALKQINNLEVLLTYTTRPSRTGEKDSYEYIFVSELDYLKAQRSSRNWDETVYSDYRYGSDAEKYINDLHHGTNIIVSVTPNVEDIKLMADMYQTKPITIWINTDAETARKRIEIDSKRSSRIEDESVKGKFNVLYQPSGILDRDINSFNALIREVISR